MEEKKVVDLSKADKQNTIEKLAELVKKLKGDRSIRGMAADSGVAASYITGIINCKYLPSAEILRKLAADTAAPQNGVTLEDLMVTAGYQTNYIFAETGQNSDFERRINAYANALLTQSSNDQSVESIIEQLHQADAQYRQAHDIEYNMRREHRTAFERMAKGLILSELLNKQITFSENQRIPGIRGYRAGLTITLSDKDIDEWWFDFNFYESSDVERDRRHNFARARQDISKLVFVEPNPGRKISLVVNDEDAFNQITEYAGNLSYRGELSVILIDAEKYMVTKEKYLAHFELGDQTKEIYIV